MKSTKEFIALYRLDQSNFNFIREDFLKGLNEYFLELLVFNAIGRQGWDLSQELPINENNFNFDKFKQTVRQVEQKFWAISNKKVGEPFSKNLWSAFYAIYVIPIREKYYPEIDQEIKNRRERYLGDKKQK